MLDGMVLREATERLMTLAVPASRAAMARDHLPEIVKLVQQTGAGSMSISLVELKPAGDGGGAGRGEGSARRGAEPTASRDVSAAAEDPLVREAARVFGAKVVHIEPKR